MWMATTLIGLLAEKRRVIVVRKYLGILSTHFFYLGELFIVKPCKDRFDVYTTNGCSIPLGIKAKI